MAKALDEAPQQYVLSSSDLEAVRSRSKARITRELIERLRIGLVLGSHIGIGDGLKPVQIRDADGVISWQFSKFQNRGAMIAPLGSPRILQSSYGIQAWLQRLRNSTLSPRVTDLKERAVYSSRAS